MHAVVTNVADDEVHFNHEDQQQLLNQPNLPLILKLSFLYESSEPFVTFCFHCLYAKDMNSPNRRLKRQARIDLFMKLASALHPKRFKMKLEVIRMNYTDLSFGLYHLGDKWKLFSIDELTSLAMLVIEKNNKNHISWTEFEALLDAIVLFHKDNPVKPKIGFQVLYENLRQSFFASALQSMEMIDDAVRSKLVNLTLQARNYELFPLSMLMKFLESNAKFLSNDMLVGQFLGDLSDRTHELITEEKERQRIAREAQEQELQQRIIMLHQPSVDFDAFQTVSMR